MRVLVGMVVLALAANAGAADVTVQPRLNPTRVSVGQPAALDVEIHGTQNAAVPAIPVPDGIRLDYRGQSTQVSIVNGAMSATLTHSFLLVPDRAGAFDVGPIRVQAGGRELDAGTVRLEVMAARAARAAPDRSAAPSDTGLRLFAALDQSRLYLHQRVPLRVRLEVAQVQVTDLRYPTIVAEGFSTGKFGEPQQRQETRDGQAVHVVEFTTDLVPLRAGETTLGTSMQLAVVVRRGNPLFDQFFGMDSAFGGRKNTTLEAEPLPVTVLPLPETGRPPSFTGAVGAFTLAVDAHPREVKAGDPVTLTFTLRGSGNLEHAQPPALVGSPAFKVYPSTAVAENEQGAAIEKRFEQVVIPQAAGEVMLPALAFSFFDPRAAAYRTSVTAPIALRVLPAPPTATPATIPPPVVAPAAQSETLGRDLVSIKDDPGTLGLRSDHRYRTPSFWLVQLVPLVLWMGVVLWDRRRQRLSGDERYARFSRAGKLARRRLGAARTALQAGEGAAFYDALAQGVHEYLAAKLDLPPGAISIAAVTERLRSAGMPPALIDEAEQLLAICEHVRFAPAADADMMNAIGRAEALVRDLERRRRVRWGWAAAVLVLGAGVVAAGENAKTAFFRGNALYGDERFAEAVQAYETVRAGGYESAPLYFNLGNAYARTGDRGRALLNYERARRLAPGDPDVSANMAYVRGDVPDDGLFSLWTRLALPLAGRFGSDALLAVAAVAWQVVMMGLIVGRVVPGIARPLRWVVGSGVVLLLLSASAAAFRVVRVDRPAWAAVLGDVPVRFEPSETGTAHFEATSGAVVEVVAERSGWAQVARRADGRRGWVPLAVIERL